MTFLLLSLACQPKEITPGTEVDDSFGTELAREEIPPAASLWVDVTRAYACTGAEGLYVIDVSDPTWPVQEDVVEIECLAVDGESGRIHVAAGDQGLRVVHPGNLAIIGGYETDFPVVALTVDAGEYQAWVAGQVDETGALAVEGVLTYSVENLNRNRRADLAEGWPVAVAYDRDGIYVAREGGPIDVLGLTMDLRAQVELPGTLAGGAGGGLLAHEGMLWAALGEAGLLGVDVSDLDDPVQAPAWEADAAWGLAALEDRLYVGIDEGLLVLDISDPTAPVEIGRAELSGVVRPEGIYIRDEKAWLTDAQDGAFVVVSIDEESLG